MNTAAIIAEYNPFHNGHAYHIAKTREAGAKRIVVLMSGDFVQRGDAALLSKRVRALTAIKNGADLVLELPPPHSSAPAEHFAKGAVSQINALGGVDTLSFGCETDDLFALLKLADAVDAPDTSSLLKKLLAAGAPFAISRERAVRQLYGENISALLQKPNAILAVEYLRALKSACPTLTPLPILRRGAGHDERAQTHFTHEGKLSTHEKAPLTDGAPLSGGFMSASYLREQIVSSCLKDPALFMDTPRPDCNENRNLIEMGQNEKAPASFINQKILFSLLSRSMPDDAARMLILEISSKRVPASLFYAQRAVLSRLRSFSSPKDFTRYFDVGEGLENRLYEGVKRACSVEELYTLVKSKRYSHARIRRIILHAFLDIEKDLVTSPAPYLRPLAFTSEGAKMLRCARVPVISRYRDFDALTGSGERFQKTAKRASRLYALCAPQIIPCEEEELHFPILVKG